MAQNAQNHDDVLELDTLKKFTIPKKERPARELLEPLSTRSREFQHEILPLIHGSYKDRDAEKRFQYKGAYLVHNSLLQNAYLERRKDMRQKGYGEKEVQDSYVFIMADSLLQAKRICAEGLKNGNSRISNLGNPDLAVCVCKHADIISPTPLQYGHLCKLVVFKLMKGKVKSMTECKEAGSQIDPTPNFDTHISKSTQFDISSVSHTEAFESSQVYLYEYGEFEVEDRPRQLYPYAVVDVRYVGHDAHVKQTAKVARLSGPTVRPSYPLNQRPPFSPMQQSPPRPLQSPRPYFPSANPVASPLAEVQQNSAQHGSLVVWSGQLTCNGTYICLVNLLSHTSNGRPARIGAHLSLTKRSPLDVIQARYFLDLQSLPKNYELEHDNLFYNYARLVPVKRNDPGFHQIKAFLERKESGASVKLEDHAEVMIMPGCILTKCLGLSEDSDHFDGLHCIFISQHSRRMLPSANHPLASSECTLPPEHSAAPAEKPTVYTPPPSVRSGTPDSVGNAHALDKNAIFSALNRDCPSPALSSVSSDLPSPGHPESRMTPSPLGHSSISSLLTPTRPPSDWDEGFQAFIPPGSLLYKGSIVSSFHDQLVLQDRRNLEKARRPLKLPSPQQQARPPPQLQAYPTETPPPYPIASYSEANYLPRTHTWPVSLADAHWQQQQQQASHSPLIQQTDPRLKADNAFPQTPSNLEQSPSLGIRPGSTACPRTTSSSKGWTPSPRTPPPGVTGSTTPAEGLPETDLVVGQLSLLDQRILAFEKGLPHPRDDDDDHTGFSPDEDEDEEEEEMTDDLADLIVKSVPVKSKQRDSFVDPNNLNIKRLRSCDGISQPDETSNGFLMSHSLHLPEPVSESPDIFIKEENRDERQENETKEEEENEDDKSFLEVEDLSDLEMSQGSDLVPDPRSPPQKNSPPLRKTLRGRWYSHLESFKTFPSLFNAACRDLEPLESILRDTEVRIADDEVFLCMKVNNDTCVKNEGVSDSLVDDCIQDSINSVLHKSSSVAVETETEAERRLLWHIALHFFLPLNDERTERHLLDSNGNAMEHNDPLALFTVQVPTESAVSECDLVPVDSLTSSSLILVEELDFRSSDIELQTLDDIDAASVDAYGPSGGGDIFYEQDDVIPYQRSIGKGDTAAVIEMTPDEAKPAVIEMTPDEAKPVVIEMTPDEANPAVIEITPDEANPAVIEMTPDEANPEHSDVPLSDALQSISEDNTRGKSSDLLQKDETALASVLPPIGYNHNQSNQSEISDPGESGKMFESIESNELALDSDVRDSEIRNLLAEMVNSIDQSASALGDASSTHEKSTDCANNEEVVGVRVEEPEDLAALEEVEVIDEDAEITDEDIDAEIFDEYITAKIINKDPEAVIIANKTGAETVDEENLTEIINEQGKKEEPEIIVIIDSEVTTGDKTKGPFENIDIQLDVPRSDFDEITPDKPALLAHQHVSPSSTKFKVSVSTIPPPIVGPSDTEVGPPTRDPKVALPTKDKPLKTRLKGDRRTLSERLGKQETLSRRHPDVADVLEETSEDSSSMWKVVDSVGGPSDDERKVVCEERKPEDRLAHRQRVQEKVDDSKSRSRLKSDNNHFHPYKRKKSRKLSCQGMKDRQHFLKQYRTPRDLQDLMGCLSKSNYVSTHLPPGGVLGKGARRTGTAKFQNFTFKRQTPNDLDDDEEDHAFSQADVPDYESKRRLAKQLDTCDSMLSQSDLQLLRLNGVNFTP